MEHEIVKDIVQKDFKSGVSAKNNKPWALHKYNTNSGKEFTSFDDLEPGDTVKLTYSEEYKNWSGGRIRKQDTQHDEIMTLLNKIYQAVTGGTAKDTTPNEAVDQFPDGYGDF